MLVGPPPMTSSVFRGGDITSFCLEGTSLPAALSATDELDEAGGEEIHGDSIGVRSEGKVKLMCIHRFVCWLQIHIRPCMGLRNPSSEFGGGFTMNVFERNTTLRTTLYVSY